jgi:uncharacterized protein with HEPN domain
MLDYAQKAVTLSKGGKRSDLDNDFAFRQALTRLIEIKGEAANRVPEDFQEKNPKIAWRQIIGMRNRLILGCDEVDRDFLLLQRKVRR